MSMKAALENRKLPASAVTSTRNRRPAARPGIFDRDTVQPGNDTHSCASATVPGHDFGDVPVIHGDRPGVSEKGSCPLPAGPRSCPYGGVCHTCPVKIQAKPVNGARMDRSEEQGTDLVREVLNSPADPLDRETIEFMESAFGHDFREVLLHTDEKAADCAKDIHARAFTVGRHIVFGRGQYSPKSETGKLLLAHELAHVVQSQYVRGNGGAMSISRPDAEEEKAADRTADAALDGRQVPSLESPSMHELIFRQAVATAPVVRPPIRPPNFRVIRGGKPPKVGERLGASEPSEMTLEEIMARVKEIKDREQAVWELERPIATLDRGGRAPDFITEKGYGDAIGNYGQVRYRRRNFHILDAIEYAVGRSNTENDLNQVLQRYLPSWRDPGARPGSFIPPLRFPDPFVIPTNMDPDGSIRMGVYAAAVAPRAKKVPSLARVKAVPIESPTEVRRRGCIVTPSASLGNDPLASMFCQDVTGSPFEYKVTSPTMGHATFDAMRGNTVYECKCGYGSLLEAGDQGKFWARLREDKLDEQMLCQTRIAADCGLQYRYIVSNSRFADFLRSRWFSVNVIHSPWEPCD